MPIVPSSVAPSVTPTPNTGIGYQNANGATPDAFGAGIGEAKQRTGKALDQFGDVLAANAEKMQADVNASAAKDLFLQGDVAIGKLQTDYNSLEGANRVNAYPKYVEDIGKVRADMKAAAPNDAVARLFDQDFARRVGYSIVDGARSAATANKQYQAQTNTAVRENSLQHIAANSSDDNRFNTELEIGKQTLQNSDEYKGASPEVRAQHDQAYVTAAWSTRLEAMSRTDPLRARELFTKNKDALDGVSQLKLENTINNGIVNVQSRVDSDKIIQDIGTGGLEEKIKRLEGYKEKPYADYKQTSSGYGTKAQPGDESIPPEQRQAIYTQRMRNELASAASIVDQFAPGLPKGTRDAMISLTYNAGSTWTQAGLGQALRAGDMDKAKSIFTQYNQAGGEVNPALVSRRVEEASWFGGENADTDHASLAVKAQAKASERAAALFPDDPATQAKYLDTLQNRIRNDYSVMQTSAREIVLQNKNTVFSEVLDPSKNVTSYEQLSDKAKASYDSAPPQMQESFRTAMRKNATRDVPMTNERQSRYDTLYGMSRNQPDEFMGLNIDNEDLPRGSKSSLLKLQADRKALLAKGTTLNSSMSVMQPLLNDAGIGKSISDPARNTEYNKFSGVYEKALDAAREKKQAPLSDKEMREIGTGLLKDVVTSPGFVWDSKEKAYSAVANKTAITLKTDDPAAHYATLPSGATFIGPDGKTRVKP